MVSGLQRGRDVAEKSTRDHTGEDGSSATSRRTSRRRRSRQRGWLRETALVVISALVLSILIKTFLVQAYYIPSGSMQNTLDVGDRVLVSKLTPGPFDIERGDILVFVDPGGWLQDEPQPEAGGVREVVAEVLTFVGLLPQHAGEHLIKRVIGVGGDTVECCDDAGRILVNGQPIEEPYLYPGDAPSSREFSVTVPEGHFWFMGDHRSNSQDSRAQQGGPGGGAVPLANVVGKAFMVMWPLDNITVLNNPGETFRAVPEGP